MIDLNEPDYRATDLYRRCAGAFSYEDMRKFHMHAYEMYGQCERNFKLKYHVWGHALDVVLVSNELLSREATVHERTALTLAALYHDVVYVPGLPSPSNEGASATALRTFAQTEFSLNTTKSWIVEEACKLILATQINNHLRSSPVTKATEAALLDADLATFGASFRTFYRRQRWVRQEGQHRSDQAACEQHAAFFDKLLTARPELYHTDKARYCWGSTAKRNVEAWCNEHGFTKEDRP